MMKQCVLWLTGGWNLQSPSVMPLGSNPLQPIRCCLVKGSRLWVGYWNRVHVVNTDSKKVEVRNREGSYFPCVLCSHRLWTHRHFPDLTANILGVWTQRAAGSFPLCGWKWCLDIVPTWPNPQALWLVHWTAATGSRFYCFGHENIRSWTISIFLSITNLF